MTGSQWNNRYGSTPGISHSRLQRAQLRHKKAVQNMIFALFLVAVVLVTFIVLLVFPEIPSWIPITIDVLVLVAVIFSVIRTRRIMKDLDNDN